MFLSIRHVLLQTREVCWKTRDERRCIIEGSRISFIIHICWSWFEATNYAPANILYCITFLPVPIAYTSLICLFWHLFVKCEQSERRKSTHIAARRRTQHSVNKNERGDESTITPSISTRDNVSRQRLAFNFRTHVQVHTNTHLLVFLLQTQPSNRENV